MQLLVIRHGIAENVSPTGVDRDRRLSAEGVAKLREVARTLLAADLRPKAILHSPWTRARETAELLAQACPAVLVPTAELSREPRVELFEEISQLDLGRDALVACVGHEPWLGQLIALAVLGDAACGERFVMKKGGVAHLAGERLGGMELLALLPPELLGRR